jgi:hypothetical protein
VEIAGSWVEQNETESFGNGTNAFPAEQQTADDGSLISTFLGLTVEIEY